MRMLGYSAPSQHIVFIYNCSFNTVTLQRVPILCSLLLKKLQSQWLNKNIAETISKSLQCITDNSNNSVIN